MSKKLHFRVAVSLAAVIVFLFSFSGAFADAPKALHIEVLEHFGVPDPFYASGSAVDSGLVCASGSVNDAAYSVSGSLTGPYRIIRVTKHFVCDSGGTFDIRMLVRLDNTTLNTTAWWSVAGGTGDYAGLRGNGTLEGLNPVPNTSILDVYDGMVH